MAQYLVSRNYEIYLTGSDLDLNTINEIIKLCPESKNKIIYLMKIFFATKIIISLEGFIQNIMC